MYKLSYAEIMEADPREARAREQVAIDHGIELMRRAEAEGGGTPQAIEALRYVQKLWIFFIENLADPTNELGAPLKDDLISIGLWTIAEADRLIADPEKSFAALIDVNKTIRDGLK